MVAPKENDVLALSSNVWDVLKFYDILSVSVCCSVNRNMI